MRWGAIIVIAGVLCGQGAAPVPGVCAEEPAPSMKLPPPRKTSAVSLEEAVMNRRSLRAFNTRPLSQEQIGQLLWAAQGITAEEFGVTLRAVPSAGALYPLEIFLATAEGLYHYVPLRHEITRVRADDIRPALSRAAHGQAGVRQAAAVFILCAEYGRITKRYGERGIFYAHLEAGHAAQNIHLQAVSLGLGSFPVGAFQERQVHTLIKAPESYSPLYIIPAGYPER